MMKKVIISVVIVAAILLVAAFVPLLEVPHTFEHRHTETFSEAEPLQYRVLHSFITYGSSEEDLKHSLETHGYPPPGEVRIGVEDYAFCVVVQNLDGAGGAFGVTWKLTTADREAAIRQSNLIQRTTEEYEELDREYYEGSMELYLEPSQIWVFICPPGGIYIAPDRTPFDHEHEVIAGTKAVEKERLVIRYETHYEWVTVFEHLRSRSED